jgi:hypothetical protein
MILGIPHPQLVPQTAENGHADHSPVGWLGNSRIWQLFGAREFEPSASST